MISDLPPIFLKNNEVTCILTSCDRHDLLMITLESFFKFNTYPVKEFFVYEDGGFVSLEIKKMFPQIKWIESNERKGQIVALDCLWKQVTTPYAFLCEDDWSFYREGFIEASMNILETHPKIMQVWLREPEDTNKHPIDWQEGFGIMKANNGLWSGTNFNPSLKRKSDYDLIGSYGAHTTFSFKSPWKSEAAISQLYNKLGFKGAILPQGYIKHIGGDRHVN